ncbi:MAG: hypothetical protein V4542_03060 [Pseudomonadota bacterium]
MPLRSSFLFALVLLSLGRVAQAQAQVTFPVDKPGIQVGDRWKFAQLDGFTKVPLGWREETVAVVDQDGIGTSRKSDTNATESYRYDLEWNRLTDFKGKTETEKRLSFPFIADKSWTTTWNWINARGREGQLDMTYKVVGTERITVPAGIYDTVKIEGMGTWKNRTAGTGGTAQQVLWYAPVAKRHVRETWLTRYASGVLDQNTINEALEVDLKR